MTGRATVGDRTTRMSDGPAVRPKADARLLCFLHLPKERLAALCRSEEHRAEMSAREFAKRTQAQGSSFPCAPLTAGLRQPDSGAGSMTASVFIIADASAGDLRALGAEVRSQAGDVFTATVPLELVPRLMALQSVRFVELARTHYPTLDVAVPTSGIGALHAAMPPLDGAGVVVGIFDTAIDFYHPDFRDAAGATRIAYLWDQRLAPVGGESGPPAGLLAPGSTSYGVEYDRVAIDAAIAQFVPGSGNAYTKVRHAVISSNDPTIGEHGTHVAGIAAGNGEANAGTYTGGAPAADIIFVAYPNLFDTGVLADNACLADALAYVFARADAMGKPCVVNVSVSDDQSGHDGTTAGEQFIDALLTEPGRAVTLSAGNANNIAAHASGTVSQGGSTGLSIVYPANAVNSDAMEIWYSGQDRFQVTVTVPTAVTTVIGPLAAGSGPLTTALPSGVEVTVTSVVDDPRDHANMISVIVIVPAGQVVPAGRWVLTLQGTTVFDGSFDAWVDRNNRTGAGRPQWQPPFVTENRLTVSVPATCAAALSVGNHARSLTNPMVLQPNSGCGPTRDGRVKPEIATVGVSVTAPRSRNMNDFPNSALYRVLTGTSQSAPLAAGACALLFQCRGATSTWADLKQVLTQTAGTTGIASVPDAGFGFGYMHVGTGCSAPPPNVDVWLRDDATDTGSEPFTGPVAWLSPDIELLDSTGNPASHPTHDPTRRYSNIVRVTVRNRGTQNAINSEVHLCWADPATNIPYPAAWHGDGIFTGAPAFAAQGNVIVIPKIGAGNYEQVEFAWAPPAVGANIAGDAHFCLLVRIENQNDPSNIGAGGWIAIGASNNIALHNLDVVEAGASGDSVSGFEIVGSDGQDSLSVDCGVAAGRLALELPAAVLPWRDLGRIERTGQRGFHGKDAGAEDWLARVSTRLEGEQVTLLTDIRGAAAIELRDGNASIFLQPRTRATVPLLRIADGARARAILRMTPTSGAVPEGFVHIGQLSSGRRVGGVSIAFGPQGSARHARKRFPV